MCKESIKMASSLWPTNVGSRYSAVGMQAGGAEVFFGGLLAASATFLDAFWTKPVGFLVSSTECFQLAPQPLHSVKEAQVSV